jgi:hypothetical protein
MRKSGVNYGAGNMRHSGSMFMGGRRSSENAEEIRN